VTDRGSYDTRGTDCAGFVGRPSPGVERRPEGPHPLEGSLWSCRLYRWV